MKEAGIRKFKQKPKAKQIKPKSHSKVKRTQILIIQHVLKVHLSRLAY